MAKKEKPAKACDSKDSKKPDFMKKPAPKKGK